MATSRRRSRARRTGPASISSSIAAARIRSKGRGALATYDVNEDRLTLWSSTQLAHEVRAFLMTAAASRRKPGARGGARRRRRLRRQVRHVSGGGGRLPPPRCCCGARSNGSRIAASISSPPCRSATSTGTWRSPFDDDGRLLGVRGRMIHDEGAYTPQGINLPYNASTRAARALHAAGL